jgi:hypothetical protein
MMSSYSLTGPNVWNWNSRWQAETGEGDHFVKLRIILSIIKNIGKSWLKWSVRQSNFENCWTDTVKWEEECKADLVAYSDCSPAAFISYERPFRLETVLADSHVLVTRVASCTVPLAQYFRLHLHSWTLGTLSLTTAPQSPDPRLGGSVIIQAM